MQRDIAEIPQTVLSPRTTPTRDIEELETPVRPARSGSSLLFEYSPSDTEDDHSRRKQQQAIQRSQFRLLDGDFVTESQRLVNFTNSITSQERYRSKKKSTDKKASDSPSSHHPQWVENLANSFRSPTQRHSKSSRRATKTMQEYPHHTARTGAAEPIEDPHERTALLLQRDDKAKYIEIASTFLRDYEAGRPATLSSDFSSITSRQLQLYRFKFSHSRFFPLLLASATISFFVACFLEGFVAYNYHRPIMACLNIYGILVFVADIWIRHELRHGFMYNVNRKHALERHHSVRSSRSERLVIPLTLFLTILSAESLSRILVTRTEAVVIFSSVFKPLVLFYVSTKARDALEALGRIVSTVLRVLIVEMLLILMFAAVACRLFTGYESFSDLSTAWLSLFELATTVVNPSIWMPMYSEHKSSALFFVSFVVISVFYMHSLVLSVVFQTYVKAAADVHNRSTSDREDLVQMAFLSLQEHSGGRDVVAIDSVREVLRAIRPHYNAMKINALIEIIDPTDQRVIDYPMFRTKIRQALNASIRTARIATKLAVAMELVAVFLAISNFIYVIMVSSAFTAFWFDSSQEAIGGALTLIAIAELLVRFNPLKIADFTPLTRLNTIFDGLALIAAFISCVGLFMFVLQSRFALEFILMGRAIDMIRIMRFFQIFRDVVRRSADVLPALTGPVVLVISTLHFFVYLGMAIWGGSVTEGAHDDALEPLYDLNNFNTYQNGAVTMFQVLVTNDWQAIAKVFTFATRCSSPFIVYPFFVIANLTGVSIMLNVVTAFFVESFVTKINDGMEGPSDQTTLQKERDFGIKTSESSIRRVRSSEFKSNRRAVDEAIDHGADADSEASSGSEMHEFDVFEREGYDNIMRTVAGASDSDEIARTVSSYFEIFETLAPGRESVGYLVCDQQTLERYGNLRFQSKTAGFLEEKELHVIVNDMHSELLALSSSQSFNQDKSLLRTYRNPASPNNLLEISGALLRRRPALSLFVTRVRRLESRKAGAPPIPE